MERRDAVDRMAAVDGQPGHSDHAVADDRHMAVLAVIVRVALAQLLNKPPVISSTIMVIRGSCC